eukprot:3572145-Rhodomonas_salina.2
MPHGATSNHSTAVSSGTNNKDVPPSPSGTPPSQTVPGSALRGTERSTWVLSAGTWVLSAGVGTTRRVVGPPRALDEPQFSQLHPRYTTQPTRALRTVRYWHTQLLRARWY